VLHISNVYFAKYYKAMKIDTTLEKEKEKWTRYKCTALFSWTAYDCSWQWRHVYVISDVVCRRPITLLLIIAAICSNIISSCLQTAWRNPVHATMTQILGTASWHIESRDANRAGKLLRKNVGF